MDTTIAAPSRREPRPGRLVAASLIGILGLLLAAAGIAGVWARTAGDHGYLTSGSHRYATTGRAIVSGSLDVRDIPHGLVGKLRVAASPAGNRALFVGVGPRSDVDRYLAGVEHSTLEDVNFGPFDATYSSTAGSRVPAKPAAQTFWAQSKVGTGTQTVSWTIHSGTWRVVVMNADGSPNVAADAKVGASIRGVAIAIALLALGAALVALAVALVAGALRRA